MVSKGLLYGFSPAENYGALRGWRTPFEVRRQRERVDVLRARWRCAEQQQAQACRQPTALPESPHTLSSSSVWHAAGVG
eukprot:COSAG02_NODE_19172_length_896_cov_1.294856_2_plen_79_part_00